LSHVTSWFEPSWSPTYWFCTPLHVCILMPGVISTVARWRIFFSSIMRLKV
jgi:hypothetical protein